MNTEVANSQQLLKESNRMALVRQLFVCPGLSRADLASRVGLTKSTVSLLSRELIDEGWLEAREVVATGELGRRPTPLFVDPGKLLLMGCEVDIESARLVITSLTGEVQAHTVATYGMDQRPVACIKALAKAMLKLHRQLVAGKTRVIGMGVGLPGGVDEVKGFLHFAPNLQWRNVPFAQWLRDCLAGTPLANVPLFVQNEADVAALGELEFNPQAADPLLYLSINQGVGAGVIVGGRLLTGARGFAGEVGHMVLQLGGPRCSCGRRGCAEAVIGPRAMLGLDPGESFREPVVELQRRLRAGDAATAKAVKKAGGYLGVLLQNLAAAYDPATIVMGGAMLGLGDALLTPALKTLADHAVAAHLEPPTGRLSAWGPDAVAVGAAALARYHLTRPLLPLPGSGES